MIKLRYKLGLAVVLLSTVIACKETKKEVESATPATTIEKVEAVESEIEKAVKELEKEAEELDSSLNALDDI